MLAHATGDNTYKERIQFIEDCKNTLEKKRGRQKEVTTKFMSFVGKFLSVFQIVFGTFFGIFLIPLYLQFGDFGRLLYICLIHPLLQEFFAMSVRSGLIQFYSLLHTPTHERALLYNMLCDVVNAVPRVYFYI